MVITGTFYDINNNQCFVNIVKDDGTHNTVTIGENGLFFGGDPIRIETEMKDTTEPIIRRSCSINLVTSDYMGDALWSDNVQTTTVTVSRGTECLFAGYVEPNSFSQPFARGLDEFTINCVDTLSVLQYANYSNTTVSTYDTNKANAGVVPFIDIINNIIADATMTRYYNIYYDCSKGLKSGNEASVFSDLSIAENYLYGESYDDIWTQEDVLSEMLQYLNLHILQDGDKFYIFDWATLQNGRNTWVELRTNTAVTLSAPEMVTLTSSMHGADDTNINVTDVYSQVSVKCDLENIETVITSPLDDDSLTSPYTGKQLYMREYISEGNGTAAKNAFRDMLKENGTVITYDKAKYIDWYIRVMNNPKWLFHTNNGTGNIIDTLTNSTETFNNGKYINQWKLPHTMHWNRLWPAILRMGSVERDAKTLDNSPTAKVSMSDYLYIPIGGNGQDDDTYSVPTSTELQSHAPIIEYMGGNGGVYSPSDDDTTNYLVFTGKILLQPLAEETKTTSDATGFTALKNVSTQSSPYYSTVPSDNDEHGRYYTRKFLLR